MAEKKKIMAMSYWLILWICDKATLVPEINKTKNDKI